MNETTNLRDQELNHGVVERIKNMVFYGMEDASILETLESELTFQVTERWIRFVCKMAREEKF